MQTPAIALPLLLYHPPTIYLFLFYFEICRFDIESTANDDSCLYRGSYTGEQSAGGGRRGGEDQTMIAGNCFSAVAYLSRFGQRPQRYAARRLYLLLKRIPYKTQAKSNFFHGPEYIQFVFPPSLFVSLSVFFILSRSLRPALPLLSPPFVRSTRLARGVIKLRATRYDVTQNCKRQTLWSIH